MRSRLRPLNVWILVSATMLAVASVAARQEPKAANVLVVTLDGMRWQEVFGGLASELLTKEAGGITRARSAPGAVRRFDGRKSGARS